MDYQEITTILCDFTAQKGWGKYHNLKDLALSVNLEASEVLEVFQWKDEQTPLTNQERDHLKEEIADTLIYLFYMCDEMGLDPYQAIAEKMKVNQTRHWKEEDQWAWRWFPTGGPG